MGATSPDVTTASIHCPADGPGLASADAGDSRRQPAAQHLHGDAQDDDTEDQRRSEIGREVYFQSNRGDEYRGHNAFHKAVHDVSRLLAQMRRIADGNAYEKGAKNGMDADRFRGRCADKAA
jgi:hypothetical protein